MASKALPCPTLLRQRLRYEPDTGKLFWRKAKVYMFPDNCGLSPERRCAAWNAKYANKEAFTATWSGYKTGKLSGVKMMAHRVIWAVFYGQWPPEMIDHINRDRADNRIGNLRNADARLNASNTDFFSQNPHISVGVRFDSCRDKWIAEIHVEGRHIRIGRFKTQNEAIAARKAAEKVLAIKPKLSIKTLNHEPQDKTQ